MIDTTNQQLEFTKPDAHTLAVRLLGDWTLADHPPSGTVIGEHLVDDPSIERLSVSGESLRHWDSALVSFLVTAKRTCENAAVTVDLLALPAGAENLVRLASAVPQKTDARRQAVTSRSLSTRVGRGFLGAMDGVGNVATFIGEAALSLGRLLSGRARLRRSELLLQMQECGAQALPIVTLISVLVGLILAFVGAVQLEQFGAQIYVANLVAIATAREMGAMMTAIIMAGRTGAAFAAQIGTMQVNQEIDALETFSIPPMDFLVMPRMIALMVMMPLLTL